MSRKLHIEASDGSLQSRLACSSIVVTGDCVSFTTPADTGPQAVLIVRGETPTEILIDLLCNRKAIGVAQGDFTITGPATFKSLESSDQLFHLVLTKSGYGTVEVSLASGFAVDSDGTDFPAVDAVSVVVSQRPVPTIAGPTQVSFDTVELDVTFDQNVVGLSLADFTAIDGTLSNLQGTGAAYTVDFDVDVGATNPQVALPPYKCQNLAGQDNEASNVYAPLVAQSRPVPTITPIREIFPTTAVKFYIDWSVDVSSEFVSGHVAVTNGTLDSLTEINGKRYLATITASGDVEVTVDIAIDQFTVTGYAPNAAGTGSCEVSTTALSFSFTPPSGTQKTNFEVAVSGTQAHSGLGLDDFIIENGHGLDWAPSDNGGTLKIAPSHVDDEYDVSIYLPAGVTRTASGIYNAAAGPVLIPFDDVGPTISFGQPYRDGDEVNFPLHLSELSTVEGSYTYPHSNSTAITGSGQNFLLTIDPQEDKTDILVTLPEGLFEDLAGNKSEAVTGVSFAFDRVGPVATLTLIPDAHAIDRPTNIRNRFFRLEFDSLLLESLTSYQLTHSAGIRIVGVTELEERRVYRIHVESVLHEHTAVLTLAASTVFDDFGNSNADPVSIQYDFDDVPPAIVSATSQSLPEQKFSWTVLFDDDVVENIGVNAVETDGVAILSYNITGRSVEVIGIPTQSGLVGVRFNPGLVKDDADNPSLGSDFIFVLADTDGPNTTITSSSGVSSVSKLIPFTITFDEPLSHDLKRTDLQLTNCVIDPINYPGTSFARSGSDVAFDIVVSALAEGDVTVTVPAGVVTDSAGNPNTSDSLTISHTATFDVVLRQSPTNKLDRKLITVTPSVATTQQQLPVEQLRLALGSLRIVDMEEPNQCIIVLNPAMTSAKVTLPAGVLTDVAGRTNREASITFGYASLTAVPSLVPVPTLVKANQPIVIDVIWNVEVNNFDTTQLSSGIRNDDDLTDVAGTGYAGTFSSMTVTDPGYAYQVTLVAQTLPDNLDYNLHVWHERTSDGTRDNAGRAVDSQAYCLVPFAPPFQATFTSDQYPETSERLIEVTITFPEALDETLQSSDLTLDNCAISAVDYPGTHFTPTADPKIYTLAAYALTADNVTITLAAGTVVSESGLTNAESKLDLVYLGPGRFSLLHSITSGDKPDTRSLSIAVPDDVVLDLTSIDEASLNYDSSKLLVTEIGGGAFTLRLLPGAHSADIVINEGEYVAEDERFNAKHIIPVTWDIPVAKPAITISNEELRYPEALTFFVNWPVKVANFDKTNLVATLIDADGNTVAGYQSAGTLSDLVEISPGYAYSGTFTLDDQPTTDVYPFQVKFNATGTDVTDAFGNTVTQSNKATVPVRGPLALTWSSQYYPETDVRTILVRVQANRPLSKKLEVGDLTLTNCSVNWIQSSGWTAGGTHGGTDFYIQVQATSGGNVTIAIDADAVVDQEGSPNIASSITILYHQQVPISAELLDLGDHADIFTLRVAIPSGFVLGDLNTTVRDLVVGTFGVYSLEYLGEVTPGYVDWQVNAAVVSLLPNRQFSFKPLVYIPPELFSKTGLTTQSAEAKLELPGVVEGLIVKDMDITISLDANTDVAIGDTLTVRGTNNFFLRYGSWNILLMHRERFGDTSSKIYAPAPWHTPPSIGIVESTIVEPGYAWEIDITLDKIPLRYELWQEIYLSMPILQIDYGYPPGSYLASVYGDTLAAKNIEAKQILARLPNEPDPLFEEKINLAEIISGVVLKWTGRAADLDRDLIVEIYSIDGTFDVGDIFDVDWGDSSSDTFDNTEYAIERSTAWETLPSAIRQYRISHTYLDKTSKTVTITAADAKYRVYAVHLADFDSTELIVPPGDATTGAITWIRPNFPQDLREVSCGDNQNGLAATLANFGAFTLHSYSGVAWSGDSVYLGNNDVTGTYETYDTPLSLRKLDIAVEDPIQDVVNIYSPNTPNIYWNYALAFRGYTGLASTAQPDLTVRYIGEDSPALTKLRDGNELLVDLLQFGFRAGHTQGKLKLVGPYAVVIDTNTLKTDLKQLPSVIELDGVFSFDINLQPLNIYSNTPPAYLRDLIIRNSPVGPAGFVDRVTLPFERFFNSSGQQVGIRSVQILDHFLSADEEYQIIKKLYDQITELTIDEMPRDVVVHMRRHSSMGIQPSEATVQLLTALKVRLVNLGKSNAFIFTVE